MSSKQEFQNSHNIVKLNTGRDMSSEERIVMNDILKVNQNIDQIYDNIKNNPSPVKRSVKKLPSKKV